MQHFVKDVLLTHAGIKSMLSNGTFVNLILN